MSDVARPRARAILAEAVGRGFVAFLVVLASGVAFALAVWAFGGTDLSFAGALGLGWLEVGAFHHVAIRLEIRDLVTPAASSIEVTIGVALLTATAVVAWLLAHAGRAVADVAGGGAIARALFGATVALGYVAPFAVASAFVDVETARPSEAVGSGVFRASLVTWQAFAVPLVIAAAAGAAGGLRSALAERASGASGSATAGSVAWRGVRPELAVGGGGRMLLAALVLTFVALFVGGIVQPDGPLALATPTTARYARAALDRPAVGVAMVAHHLALAPAEAAWALVPAMGGCDRVVGDVDADVLCYRRFPVSPGSTVGPISSEEAIRRWIERARFEPAPPAYLLFLLVPLASTIAGGVWIGRRIADRRQALATAVAAGAVFAAAVAIVAVFANVTVGYRSSIAGEVSSSSFAIGPDPVAALGLALAWGSAGGVLGSTISRSLPASRPRR